MGVNVDVEDLLDKLAKALTFRLTLDMNFQFKDWDSEGTVGTQVNEEANGKVERLVAATALPYTPTTYHIPIVSGGWADILDECAYGLDQGQSTALGVSRWVCRLAASHQRPS